MRGTGIESSRPPSAPPLVGSAASFLLHAGVIAGTLLYSAHVDSLPPDEATPISAQFLYPLLRPMPKPVQEQLSYIGLPSIEQASVMQSQSPSAAAKEAIAPPPPTQLAVDQVKVEEPPRAFSELEVDSAAVRDPSSVGPVFPPKLLLAKLEGVTRVQFIVDSTGRVQLSSLVILDSTHPDFTQAVRDVLPRMKFQPARMGKRPVAQLVEQGFAFRIEPP